jgi:hypothetical protein
MNAIRVSEYGGPSVLKLEEVPTPQPGPNQVFVRILAARRAACVDSMSASVYERRVWACRGVGH